jgi:hypothetical protein
LTAFRNWGVRGLARKWVEIGVENLVCWFGGTLDWFNSRKVTVVWDEIQQSEVDVRCQSRTGYKPSGFQRGNHDGKRAIPEVINRRSMAAQLLLMAAPPSATLQA